MTTKLKAALVLMLALCLVLPAVACGSGSTDGDSKDATQAMTESTDSADSTEDSSEDSSEEASMEYDPVLTENPLNYKYMKGSWLYQYTNEGLFKTNGKQRPEADFRKKVEQVFENLQRDGYNTLFLQVRGHGDSFYPSEVSPPTTYVVDSYEDSFDYDPLKIFCEIAKEYKISLHAWINPYRLLTANQMAKVPETYRIGKWYKEKEGDYVIQGPDGRYYCNPAYEEVQQLVIDGVMELCENYDIAGIHMDDYFYISIEDEATDLAFDQKAYDELSDGADPTDLEVRKEWRRQNVNTLVKKLFAKVHEYNPDMLFGISPGGNIDNNQIGYLCADVKTWCSTPGYVDYIAPQVYWSFSHSWDKAKFGICTKNWGEMVTCEDVRLIVGIGLYRAVEPTQSTSDPDWFRRKDNIKRMLNFVYGYENASGFIMFSYESMYNIITGGYNTAISEEQGKFLPLLKQEPQI